jgi:hypothetical protein
MSPLLIALLSIGGTALVSIGGMKWIQRQSLSVRGRILKDLAAGINKLPKGPSDDDAIIARAVARKTADADALAAFKSAVNQIEL